MSGMSWSVKHLNPRQGITTYSRGEMVELPARLQFGVKHLNPRQGITTDQAARQSSRPTGRV